MKRIRIFILLLCVICLTSCQTVPKDVPAASLPPASLPFEAPVGTEDMQYTAYVPLYLPSPDSKTLVSEVTSLTVERGKPASAFVIPQLFSTAETTRHLRLGGNTRLYLSGRYPLELSGNVCTVQLDTSSLSHTGDALYTAALSLAATLNSMDGIRYINLLINERAVGMDLTENLPMGSITSRTDLDLNILLDQMEARKTPLGSDPSLTPLSQTVTLYYPLLEESGFLSEIRNVSFEGQSVTQLAQGLLAALSVGSQYYQNIAGMPDLLSLSGASPEVSELPGGGRLITLHFVSDLISRLQILGFDPASVLGAIVYTLSTYIPSVGAIRFFSGNTLITSIQGSAFGTLIFEEGQMRRRQYTPGLRDLATIYLPRDGQLTTIKRAVPAGAAKAPSVLMQLLSDGPTNAEAENGIGSVFPSVLDENDLIGIGFENNTLLLNLSSRCEGVLTSLPAELQQTCAYAIVLTLCENLGARHLRFFFDSRAPIETSSGIYWGGDFMLNHDLLEHSRG